MHCHRDSDSMRSGRQSQRHDIASLWRFGVIPKAAKIFLAGIVACLFLLPGCQSDQDYPVGLDPPPTSPLSDKKPPTVLLTQPQDGDTVSNTIVIAAAATDNVEVYSVEFLIDDVLPPNAVEYNEPYEHVWDTTWLADGSIHSIYAKATDTSDNSAFSDTIYVTVFNGVIPSASNVIVLVIDGARYTETFGDPDHTNVKFMWNNLRPQGTMFTNFRNEGVTSTCPGHTSIETGTWQYIANDGSERPSQPTFFEYLRSEYALSESVAYVAAGKAKLDICSYSTHMEYGTDFGAAVDAEDRDDAATYPVLLNYLQAERPRLVMANFASVDRAGHSGVWNDYVEAIQAADSLAHELWEFIESDEYYSGRTYLFITNDHGRHTTDFTGHGDGCEGCRHLMCLVMGPNIRQGYTITSTHTQIDICPTIGSILDFSTPYSSGTVLGDMYSTLTAVP